MLSGNKTGTCICNVTLIFNARSFARANERATNRACLPMQMNVIYGTRSDNTPTVPLKTQERELKVGKVNNVDSFTSKEST